MSKNITIAEGSQAKNFSNVTKIRTNLMGGGTTDWIPEEDAGMYANLGIAEIDKNGTYTASEEGLDGFSQVAVSVQPKTTTLTVTKNGTYKASKKKVDGFSEVSVQVPTGGGGELVTKNITENGTYNASDDNADGYSSVTVNVSGGGSLITKEITKNGTYNASDDNASGYSSVTVNVTPTHGRTIVNGLNNAPVSSRISTADFFADLSEKAYEIGKSYYTAANVIQWLDNTLRTGLWISGYIPDIFNYNNLVLLGWAAIVMIRTTPCLRIRVYVDGIMDETGEITLTNDNNKLTYTEYNGNKFTARAGTIIFQHYPDGSDSKGNGFSGIVEDDINNHSVGADSVESAEINDFYDGFNDAVSKTNIITNLTGGTVA